MGYSSKPIQTRYRFVSSKDLGRIRQFFDTLGVRVQLYDLVVKGGKFYQTYVPDDDGEDVPGGDLD